MRDSGEPTSAGISIWCRGMTFQKSTLTHCKRRHEFTPDNTRSRIAPSGYVTRTCKSCETITKRSWVARQDKVIRPPRRTKRCNGCGLTKAVYAFYGKPYGYSSRCKLCHALYAREWARTHATPERRARQAERKRIAYKANAEVLRAKARSHYQRTKGKYSLLLGPKKKLAA